MEGLMVLGAYAVYVWLSVWVIRNAIQAARHRGIAGWKWGVPAGLVMYHLLLWDWVPTLMAYRHYCQKDAGFVVHKTLAQWKLENPGVAETLKSSPASKAWGGQGHSGHPINDRFAEEFTSTQVFLSVQRDRDWITDIKTKEIMSENIDYSAGPRTWGTSLDDYRSMFFRAEQCGPATSDQHTPSIEYSRAIYALGNTKKDG